MPKFIRVFAIFLIIFSLFLSFYSVYAGDVNMNLTSNEVNQNDVINNNSLTDGNALDSEVPPPPSSDLSGVTNPSSIGAISEEGLSFSNILSILLITVGIVLILLSIAIIIKLS